jgi:hypothetical protein
MGQLSKSPNQGLKREKINKRPILLTNITCGSADTLNPPPKIRPWYQVQLILLIFRAFSHFNVFLVFTKYFITGILPKNNFYEEHIELQIVAN